MAFSFNGSSTGRGRFRGGHAPLTEMNVVPLVDVVLVLLIMFMITAHVMEFGFEVDVPKVREVRQSVEDLPVVALTRQGEIYLNEKPVNINVLGEEIKQRFPQSQSAYVRADKETVYDPLAQVISKLHESGIKVNLVTQPEDSGGTAGR